jgi:hypothetical protein
MNDNARCPAVKKYCPQCKRKNEKRLDVCENCGNELRCKKWCVTGYSRCDSHGAPNPQRNFYGRGTMTTGSKSSFQITRLAAKYNQMQSDGRLLSNRQAIDVVDTRIVQLLERVDADDAPDRMQKLLELWKLYTASLDSGRTAESALNRNNLEKEFEKAYHDYKAWEQIFLALDTRRKMVESEVKVLQAINAIITAEDAYEMSAKLLAAVMRVINDDPKKMKQVQYEFSKIIGEVSDKSSERDAEHDERDGGEGGGESGYSDMDKEEFLHPRDEE